MLNKIIEYFSDYEKSYELDRLWPTFIIPEENLESFVGKCKEFLKSKEKNKGELSIQWNSFFNKFECIITNYK